MAETKKTTNGKALTVAKGTKPAEVLNLVADVLETSKASGKGYFAKLVVVREEETGKVYLGKAFADRIGLYVESVHLTLETKVTRGKVAKSK